MTVHWSQIRFLTRASTAQRKHDPFETSAVSASDLVPNCHHDFRSQLTTTPSSKNLDNRDPPRCAPHRAPGHRLVFESIEPSRHSPKLPRLPFFLPQVSVCCRSDQAAGGLRSCLMAGGCNHHCENRFLHQTTLAICLQWVAEDYLV